MTRVTTPDELACSIDALVDSALIGFDVDGVLAPIVAHAEQSRLTPGVAESLGRLARRCPVAIVSGRSLDSLERRFEFETSLHVIGSHGLEIRGAGPVVLDDDEQYTFDQLEILGAKTVEAIGAGAWLEYKPASVVVHTREADPDLARPAIDALDNLASMIDGAQVKHGHEVVELLARTASKGTALFDLARRLDRARVVYFGDDVTDEDVFTMMGNDDLSVRVGDGETSAALRLSSPTDVAETLSLLATGS